jgi:hypothetical protein
MGIDISQIANEDNYISIGEALNPSNTGATDFFNGISSGVVDTTNNIGTGWGNIAVPAIINTLDTIAETTVETADTIATGTIATIDTIAETTVETADIIATGTVETAYIIDTGFYDATTTIDRGFQENVIDVLTPIGQDIINGKYSPIMFLNQQLKGMNNNTPVDNTDYSVYLIMGAVAVGGVLLL